MKNKSKRRFLLIPLFAVVVLTVIGLIVFPMISFRDGEKKMLEAGKLYFERNQKELPVGEGVKTISLSELYKGSYLKDDIYVPFTHKLCSLTDSWVKVKKDEYDYKYYVYLKCGSLQSNVDHTGPKIKLIGDEEITVGKGEEFKDPGVKSVSDAVDGKININKVSVKGTVDIDNVGTYPITYTAYDSLGNKTVVTRNVVVVAKLANSIKERLGTETHFKGNPNDNYLKLSNMFFRIYGVDSDNNVVIVSDENTSYVSYSALEKWLDYYYDHLNKKTQEMIIPQKYCNETLDESKLKTTECNSYTESRKVYIPSIDMINQAKEGKDNFMLPGVISWVSNKQSSDRGYSTIGSYQGNVTQGSYLDYSLDSNLNVRPLFTIKGDALISSGDGTANNPYKLGDVVSAKAGALVNERYTGEYVSINGEVYRIVDIEKDGTTKIISDFTINGADCTASSDSQIIVYNPKKTTSVAYCINNKAIAYINTKYFVNHTIKVPTYKDKIIYGKEVETKEYKVKLSAPNMFEMFSALKKGMKPYWFLNSSKEARRTGMVSNEIPAVELISRSKTASVRVVAYLKDSVTIYSGSGTLNNPYNVN